MTADTSAYAVLGLEPGANAGAIEQAYKRLIKQYHPDRAGGDSRRAAEINRAYRELRLAGRVKAALDLEQWEEPGGVPVRTAVVLLGLAGAATLVTALTVFLGSGPAVQRALTQKQSDGPKRDPMSLPVTGEAVETAVADARRISRASDEMSLSEASRDCHRQLRAKPTLALLDRCAAFDDAVVLLQNRDPLRDRGPFGELAVTGRKMNAAALLSNDPLAIDSRLDQIRLRVELALAPPPPQPEPAAD